MSARITLLATAGPLKGQEFAFSFPASFAVGRSDDCLLRIHGDRTDRTASRRHCRLDIDPPHLRVRDLGSLNGTFVNGRMIGNRVTDLPPIPARANTQEVELHDGDRLALGSTELLVSIERDVLDCGAEEARHNAEIASRAEPTACY
jgi:pSer/pThr/pTyr-binding forkhead associated (FHA) protein